MLCGAKAKAESQERAIHQLNFSFVIEREQFSNFFAATAEDPRINTTHVSLYMALLLYWKEQRFLCPMYVFSHEIMKTAKILSSATYAKSIRDLNDFGYIRYEPSYKRNQGSKVYMLLRSALEDARSCATKYSK
jgi:hypothetical protein